ncbi:hypothetical protein FF011L_34310 [Roseimaritima multifibrata]|uniref:Uncharacterized protein n=1 Tax=Roseimaritima multifibrata TaxID=1930274 RepID=A0A517MID4_9BACT|nr:hypothetical protein FF011L_34310 [Roseimaritima multifibrata]
MSSVESLLRLLFVFLDRRAVFVHPSQEAIGEMLYKVPARVWSTARSGKTIKALHRAAGLALRSDEVRSLMNIFWGSLGVNLRRRLLCVSCDRSRGQLVVNAIDPYSSFLNDIEGAAKA